MNCLNAILKYFATLQRLQKNSPGTYFFCLVICERASLGDRLAALGFTEGEHYIGTDFFHVIEDTIAMRDAFRRNDPMWKRMTESASGKVSEQHTTSARSAQIHRLCTDEDVGI